MEFGNNLDAGRELVSFPSDEELRAWGVPISALKNPDYVKAVAGIPDIELFDAEFFGFTPREAELADPQIKLFLESSHAALENAGYDPARLTDVGVFGTTGVNLYTDTRVGMSDGERRSGEAMSIGVLARSDFAATLVSYKYGFRGPSMSVQTACSSSMVAVHLAVNSLRNSECDIALAGGAEVEFPVGHGHWWAPGGPLSRDGHCRPFSTKANGTIFGSGVGVVVLKRLTDAVADGDSIRAVIRSIAVNNDGADKVGFAAPSVQGQAAAMAEAIELAGVTPDQLDVVELHATGTTLGDPIEVAALRRAFSRTAKTALEPGGCLIGSVKGNIGHLGHASGVASLIKMSLALERESIPASINIDEPNPKLELDGSPFSIVSAATAWSRRAHRPRLAGLNSLGIGGTNVHAILEEGPVREPVQHPGRPRLVVWSATSQQGEREYRQSLARHFGDLPGEQFADTVMTLQQGRTEHGVRGAVVASSAAEAAATLREGRPLTTDPERKRPRIAFLFPGQGSQYVGMAHGLYESEPAFTKAFDTLLDLFAEHDIPLWELWLAAKSSTDLESTLVAQPLLFAVEIALSELWSHWGVSPDALLGHSVGEMAAATVAGVFELRAAVALVAARSKAMARMPAGGMLAVAAGPEAVRPVLTGGLTIAAVNSADQTVIAGPLQEIANLETALAGHGLAGTRLHTSHAFHSSAMLPAVAEFERAFAGVRLQEPRYPVYSAATGALLSASQATDPAFWARQLVEPVMFGAALDAMLSGPHSCLIEVGPGRTLSWLVGRHPTVTGEGHVVVSSLPPRKGDPSDDHATLLAALGTVWTQGYAVDWDAVEGSPQVRRVPAPGYPYARARHWIDETAKPAPPQPSATGADRPAADECSPFSYLSWHELPRVGSRSAPRNEGRALVVHPADRAQSAKLIAALQQAGYRPILVRLGESFREIGEGFEVRLGVAEDLESLFAQLADRGIRVNLVVHAATLGAWEQPVPGNIAEQLESSCMSLLDVVRNAIRFSTGKLPAVLAVSHRSVDVSGGETLDPAKATLHGFIRTLNAEEPALACRLIDIDARVGEEELIAEIGAAAGEEEEVVALRGDRRWGRREHEFVAAASERRLLRPEGTYVITGGLGGLGLAVAKELAYTGLRPRLILLGRRGLDGRTDRGASQARAVVEEMESLGARVRTMACDVSDQRALARAVDFATAEFGAVNGVFHLAGVAGDGMLQLRSRQQIETVMAPKVLGTLLLKEVLSERGSLDFFVGFSSRAAIGGLLGSGDYAAANAFLDAFAVTATTSRCRFLSVNWPDWASVGMAATSGRIEWERKIGPAGLPILDEHRIGGIPVLPGTAHLDLVLEAFRTGVAIAAGRAVRLQEVVFHRPLAAPEDRQVSVTFTPLDGRWDFVVRSSGEGSGDWPVYSTGSIALTDARAEQVDLSELLARYPRDAAIPDIGVADGPVTAGPRWDSIKAAFRPADDADERVFRLVLSDKYAEELHEHTLHPALLDTAVSIATNSLAPGARLPFMYESVIVHSALRGSVYSHVRGRRASGDTIVADVDLIDESGRVAVEIRGFTMRPLPADDVRAGALEWTSPDRGDKKSLPVTGIQPEEGGRLLLDLLHARTPPQVAVRAFVDGRPVPIGTGSAVAPQVAPAPPAATPTPAEGTQKPDRPAVADGVLAELRAMWTETLGVTAIADDDDYFDLGGNSLVAVRLVTQIRERYGVELGVAEIFDHPTLETLAAEVVRIVSVERG
jgi:acyl transferase domain-containing protein